jgi:hypothetical protein
VEYLIYFVYFGVLIIKKGYFRKKKNYFILKWGIKCAIFNLFCLFWF